MLVKLLTYTPEPDKLVAAAAKLLFGIKFRRWLGIFNL